MNHIKMSLINFFKKIIFVVRVSGESCWPILVPGKLYFATGILRARIGDFVVFRNPKNVDEVFIKRVVEARENQYAAESLVSWGSSSKDFGLVDNASVLGKIVLWNKK